MNDNKGENLRDKLIAAVANRLRGALLHLLLSNTHKSHTIMMCSSCPRIEWRIPKVRNELLSNH